MPKRKEKMHKIQIKYNKVIFDITDEETGESTRYCNHCESLVTYNDKYKNQGRHICTGSGKSPSKCDYTSPSKKYTK